MSKKGGETTSLLLENPAGCSLDNVQVPMFYHIKGRSRQFLSKAHIQEIPRGKKDSLGLKSSDP